MSNKSILFIDSRVPGYQSFIDGLSEPAEVFILEGGLDGVAQMADYLKGRTGIDAIHVISHGSQGTLYLGGTVLDGGNLDAYGLQLASIGSALTPTGDILLYGCNVAQGDVGLQFITSLAQLTGADVAASESITGAGALGGNLEQAVVPGEINVLTLPLNQLIGLLGINTAPTFAIAGDGKVTTDFGSTDSGFSISQQGDGRILVAGVSGDPINSNFALARYNANGSLDTSFDADGKLTTDFGSGSGGTGQSSVLQTDGKILVAGYAKGAFAVVRYNTNGSLDTSFDVDGKLTTDFGSGLEYCSSIVSQADGKILVAGSIYNFTYNNNVFVSAKVNIALARYNVNGSLDTSFDTDGKVLTTEFDSSADSMALQPDGKILVAGSSNGNFVLARYNTDGSLDASFGSSLDGQPIYTGSNAVVLDSNVQILDAELRLANYSGATLTLARHAAADVNDVFSVKTSGNLSALTSGSFFAVGGVTIGLVISNGNGTLQLGFNSNATQALVSQAMQQIAYANTANIPPAQAQIDWTFNDGNTGAQGIGGALDVTGNTIVNITARNVAPVVTNPLPDVLISQNQQFNRVLPADAFTDANAGTPFTYRISMDNGTALPSWLSFDPTTRTLGGNPSTVGDFDLRQFDIKITAIDNAGASVADVFRLTVASFTSSPGNDTFTSRPGNDIIEGGAGIDTAIFNGNRANYTVTKYGGINTVRANSGTDGTDTLQNVERLKFTDTTVALDIDGNGGQAYRVYQAAFNRTPDSGGLGFWINTMDGGASLRSVAEGFTASAEFKALYGTSPTNAEVVTKLYNNVLGRPGEAGGFNFWLGILDSKADTVAGVLAAFSESPENQAGLVGVIGNGFTFTPFV